MKEAYYFSHDSNSRSDEKIIRVRAKYGAAGYGVFFMIVEMLREANAYQLLQGFQAIAYEVHEDQKMIEDIVLNFGLFEFNEKYFWSESLKSRMLKKEEITKKRQEAGKKGGLAKAKQKSSKCLAVKESKVKESKVNIKSPSEIEQAPVQYGNIEINKMLEALKGKVGIRAFVDSSIERNMAKHCVNLIGKIGNAEFVRRLDALLADSFHRKNCNKIKYIYNNLKGFIEPNVDINKYVI